MTKLKKSAIIGSAILIGVGSIGAENTVRIQNKDNVISSVSDVLVDRNIKDIYGFRSYMLKILIDERLKIDENIGRFFRRNPENTLTEEEYVEKLVTVERIVGGKLFLIKEKKALELAEEKYKVPKEIIVAILGIETSYGLIKGKYDPVSAFVSIIEHYPKRIDFATNGLADLLYICYTDGLDPFEMNSSYAGCIGPGQFFPPTWKLYGVDGDGDGIRDFKNIKDVIPSVANLLSKNGWNNSDPIKQKKSLRAYNPSDNYVAAIMELAVRLGWGNE
ncbi:lytic transglycosylase family protein [Candidatus Micrarchaeota archaeon]|nr:lytic transglycosylase family protein [Candidatus Micrarchaeota archaeon]